MRGNRKREAVEEKKKRIKKLFRVLSDVKGCETQRVKAERISN